jgi:hypothetical protein
MLTFSICMLHLPAVSSYYYNPTRAKDLKRISAKQDSNQDWLQKGQLWLHQHVNSDRFDVQVPSLICDPTKKRIQNEQIFSLRPPSTTEKKSFKSCSLIK